MSSITADTYPESVDSCCPLTPPTFPPSLLALAAAPCGAPVRRQLDFADADANASASALEDYDDFLICVVDSPDFGTAQYPQDFSCGWSVPAPNQRLH
ncbi:hypothetical protein E2562_014231 [Oryza meyeriana var. granulata]|uniref:Uncharacterized protein n=1 Tax=Oryza meyeriana var. granulata TaxID=110450 RepID=A0A6G1BJA1_9ORYZ|nr:hypothetical protein E2562_014231 [Oryza meyeriana var. granulata]